MGASWQSLGAALLLALAAALAPGALAGSASDPEVTDPAGDQEVEAGPLVVPGVNDEAFDDVDLVAAWLEERTHDCVGEATGTCPTITIVVQTTAGWTSGTMTLGFAIERGPTSLPSSTASGQAFTLTVTGTTVAGVDNSSAANAADGLRIVVPLPRLGAVGGDLLTNLTIATTRTDPGLLQGVSQDDQTGSDDAGPGRAYTFARSAVNPRLLLDVVSVGGRPGAYTATARDETVPVVLRITNLGIDADAWQLGLTSAPPLEEPPSFIQAFTPIAGGASTETTVSVSLRGMPEGPVALTFAVTSERGAQATAATTITVDLPSTPPPPVPPAEREVKPAGLTFLTGGAEALGFDDGFGSYGEAFLLALIVLLTILAIFLLMALGRSTVRGQPEPESPMPTGGITPGSRLPVALAGPAGLAETVRAGKARPREPAPSHGAVADDAGDEDDADFPSADFGALMAAAADLAEPVAPERSPAPVKAADAGLLPTASGAASPRIRIEEVRHSPREPAAGEQVSTEVLLRNDGGAATLRIALSVDGKPVAERVVQVPAGATKAVELPWNAGPGDNRVRIQAFPA